MGAPAHKASYAAAASSEAPPGARRSATHDQYGATELEQLVEGGDLEECEDHLDDTIDGSEVRLRQTYVWLHYMYIYTFHV